MRKLFNIASDTSSEISQDEELPVTTTTTVTGNAATAAAQATTAAAKTSTFTDDGDSPFDDQHQSTPQQSPQNYPLLLTSLFPDL